MSSVKLPTRETAPFLYDIGARTIKGAAIGLALGFVFFKSNKTRAVMTYYGAGFGLGMSYTQARFLYSILIGKQNDLEDAFQERKDDLAKEAQLRARVSI